MTSVMDTAMSKWPRAVVSWDTRLDTVLNSGSTENLGAIIENIFDSILKMNLFINFSLFN